jgi:hypothetical protein
MKQKWFIGVLVTSMLITAGCSGKSEVRVDSDLDLDEPIVIDSETIGVTDETESTSEETAPLVNMSYDFEKSIKDIFPLAEGYQWLYIGSAEYASVETLSKIDEQHPDVTELYIEGLIEDMSGMFMSDTSYLKQYGLFENQLVRRFGPYESVVLKSPVNKGEGWENLYFDPVYGLFEARYIVREATKGMVKVEMTPVSPAADGVPEALKITTTYEIGKGITSENRVYVYDNEGVEESYEFGYGLYEEQEMGQVPFVSRYFSKDPYISSIYHKGYFDYAIREATAYQYLYKNRFRLTDSLIGEGYAQFIDELDKEDIRSIAIAENVFHIYSEKMASPNLLVSYFLEHYEEVIHNNQFLLADWFEEGELERISAYDVDTNIFSIDPAVYQDDYNVQAKLSLINDNGLGYYFDNGQAVIKPSATYIGNRLYYLVDIPMQSYLTLLQQVYNHMPYYRDGFHTLTLDELQNFILAFEPFRLSEDAYLKEGAEKWSNEFLYQYLKPTQMIYDIDGVPMKIHEDSLVHYKKTLQQLKNEKQATILSLVIELIEKNNGYYTKELGEFLVQVGVEVPANYL